MVGIVIISHSLKLAQGISDLINIMAPDSKVRFAAGKEDGSFGTCYGRIREAVEDVYSRDGVLVIMDLGSAVITAEEVVRDLGRHNIEIVDCPIVEGTVAAAVVASENASLKDVLRVARASKSAIKF